MIRKTFIGLLLSVLMFVQQGQANEGMWLPFMVNDMLYEEMQGMGLQLSREQIFSFNDSSLKDAIVSFGGGCTAEMISSEGLLLTNHHCGYGRIQSHSTPEHDYLTDGFWAMSKAEELPNPGLFVSFLVSVTDVTSQVEKVIKDHMTYDEQKEAISEISDKLVEKATKDTHYKGNVRAMFAGNEYYMFIYERFTDVRLVGAPPSSIGKFGGDTDNWMWPRHTGDFSLFRVYTAPDGTPAEYHADNVPLEPRHHLPVSIKGVEEGDFAMILGYPGSTDRYLTSMGIDFKLENELPVRIDIRRQKLDIIEAAMAASTPIRIMYASKQSGIANYWKNFIGMSNALKKHNVADEKRMTEEVFSEWVMQDIDRQQQYGEVMNLFEEAYEGYRSFGSANYIFYEALQAGPALVSIANQFKKLDKLHAEDGRRKEIREEVERLQEYIPKAYRNYSPSVDKQLWEAMMKTYYELTPPHLVPETFREVVNKYDDDFSAFAHEVYNNSIFASEQSLADFLQDPDMEKLRQDLAYVTVRAAYEQSEEVNKQMDVYDEHLSEARKLFIKGLMEMSPDGMFYPDANSTMRFTYGTVGGYQPFDGVHYNYYTTLEGVMEKENPGHHEFVVHPKLVELYQAREYGEYGEDGELVVNFITNNDITGGNSGSGVLDGEGNLIGLAFDGNWEAMSGDILFEENMQRCINMDTRYLLFIIDKFAGATHLIDEMTIVGREVN